MYRLPVGAITGKGTTMTTATVHLISPAGVPITLAISPDDDKDTIIALVERADKLGGWLLAHGWATAHAEAAGPSARELDGGPTFAGFPCSPMVNEAGLPVWILYNGQQAMRREKQGDTWYSVRGAGGDGYIQVLRIPKGEIAPAVRGL
jgi:hypothetical protein